MKQKQYLKIFLPILLSIFLSACFKTKADIEKENSRKEMEQNIQKNLMEQGDAVQRLEAKVGYMEGKLEEQLKNKTENDAAELNAFTDYAKRVVRLEEKLTQIEKNQLILFDEVKRIKEDGIKKLQKRKKSKSAKNKKKSGHRYGIDLFKKKNYSKAIPIFEEYLRKYPRGNNATKVSYYLGESYYRTKKYDQAIVAYSTAHELNPKSNFGRKSTLGIARSFRKTGNKKEAKAFAELLVDSFPKSNEAKQAKKLLQ